MAMKHKKTKSDAKDKGTGSLCFVLRIKPDLGEWLSAIGRRGGRSRNELIVAWLEGLREAVERIESAEAGTDKAHPYSPDEALDEFEDLLVDRVCDLEAAPRFVLYGRCMKSQEAAGRWQDWAAMAKDKVQAAHCHAMAAECERDAAAFRKKGEEMRGAK